MEASNISKATLGRLPRYFAYLKSVYSGEDEYISASTIAKGLSLGEVQVRKDLAFVTASGKPKVGYNIKALISDLEKFFSTADTSSAVVAGDGHLGKALLEYEGFSEYGVKISAGFDTGKGAFEKDIASYIRDNNIKIGIIAVRAASAQYVCDIMTGNGIKAVWNLSPCTVNVPEDVSIKNENLALSLAYLQNQLAR